MHILEIVIITAFFSALFMIFVFGVLVVRYALNNRSHNIAFPRKSIYVFAFFVLLAWASGVYRTMVAKNEVSDFLSGLNTDSVLFINGSKVENPGKILSVLSQLDYDYSSHNSIPKILLNVRIVNKNQELKLELFRDSTITNEYWVFYPKYGKIVKKEIAKVTTHLLDQY